MRLERLTIGVVAAVIAAACSGDSNDGGGGGNGARAGVDGGTASGGTGGTARDAGLNTSVAGSTGAPSAVQLGMLNNDQLMKVCNWSAAKGTAAATEGCRVVAIVRALQAGVRTDSALRSTCKAIYEDCVSTPPEAVVCKAPPQTCTATVGEFEACANDEAKAIAMFAGAIPTCDTITVNYDPGDNGPTYNTPATCTTYGNKCAGYVPGQPESAESKCVRLIDVLCGRLAMCAQGGDGGVFDVEACKADIDCSQATAVSATYDMCLTQLMTQSCADYAADKTPASCAMVLQ